MTTKSERISLGDSQVSALTKLSEGNPGAVSVMVTILKHAAEIDPDNAMGAWGPILHLDSFGIYGSRIWILFKGVCNNDLHSMMACLRAAQLGLLKKVTLDRAIDRNTPLELDQIISAVEVELPGFGGILRKNIPRSENGDFIKRIEEPNRPKRTRGPIY